MGSYRNISIAFWTDQKIDDSFTPEDKYFYLYLLTNPHTNICGCYEISWKQLSNETGYTKETVLKLMDRMQNIHDVIRYNEDTMEILLLNWWKYNWSCSETLRKAVEGVANYIKDQDFKEYILNAIKQKTENRKQKTENRKQKQKTETDTVSDTDVSIGYRYPMDRVSGQKQKKTKFNNFEERNYNYEALEKELRNKPTG
jgi:hypothetical protein